MKTRKQLWAVSILLLAALCLAGCTDQEAEKGNALVDAGNKSLEEANKQTADAQKQLSDLLTEAEHDFPENRAALKGKVDAVTSLYDQCLANLKIAAEKYEAVSKLKIDDKLKDYYSTLAQSYRKMADQREISKKQAKLVTDESIQEHEEFVSKVNAFGADKDKLQAEVTSMQDKAKKIQTDNPGLFGKKS
jgi:hypothetical protein